MIYGILTISLPGKCSRSRSLGAIAVSKACALPCNAGVNCSFLSELICCGTVFSLVIRLCCDRFDGLLGADKIRIHVRARAHAHTHIYINNTKTNKKR